MKTFLDFKNKCLKWEKKYKTRVVFNNQLKATSMDEVKYILVGDNPGKEEIKHNEYLVGDTGLNIRLFFERFLVKDFDKEVIVLNKTPIATNTSEELKTIKSKKLLKISQVYMANLIYNISKEQEVKVVIMGLSSCRKSNGKWNLKSKAKDAYFCCFFKQIKNNFKENKNKIYLIKHFSRNQFYKDFDIKDYRNDPLKSFLKVGISYRNEFFKDNKT